MNSKALLLPTGVFILLTAAAAGAQVTVNFDNGGAESGITTPGTRDFSFMGSTWSGGIVATERIFPLYASGSFSYEVEDGEGSVSSRRPSTPPDSSSCTALDSRPGRPRPSTTRGT